MEILVTVSASFGSLLIFQSNPAEPPADEIREDARKVIVRRSRQASLEHAELLRAHVAGLVAAKKLRQAQRKAGIDVLNNEFIIARQTLIAPARDQSTPMRQTETGLETKNE